MIKGINIASFILILFLFSCIYKSSEKKQPEKRLQMDGIELAMQQEFRMTRDPQLNIIPRERLYEARAYMESIGNGGGLTGRLTALGWQERGPNNVGGRTRAIMIDKRDATGNTVFAGSVSGGIFKTTNFTNATPTWTIVNDFLPNLAISVLVQDAANPNEMYASTGEGWFNIDAVRGGGIFKSTDGGNTWNLMPSTAGFEYIQDFVIDNNGNFFAALRNATSTNRGVVRSTDRGATWVQVLGAPIAGFNTGRAGDIEVAANGDIYATLGLVGAAFSNRSVVMKSSFAINGANTGALGTWVNITPSTPTVTQRTEIVVAPSDAQRVYLFMQDSASSEVLNVFRSTNGGNNWTTLSGPAGINNGTNSQTWYNLIGAVDPNNANIIIAGGFNLARSTDGGDNWTTITSSATVHVDHHALVFDGSSRLINGNDGGIYYSVNINAPTPAFVNKNTGYNTTQYYGCDLHPSTVNYFLAGAQDNGTQRFTNAGINTTSNVSGNDGMFCHIDQTNGNLQITGSQFNNYFRSLDGGATVPFSFLGSVSNNRGQFINPTDLDDNSKVLYCGDDAGKYYIITNLLGTPAGTQINIGAIGTREITAIKVDPSSANTIWIGASFGSTPIAPAVVKVTNANTITPNAAVSTLLSAPAGAAISSIDVDPANASHILVTLANYGVTNVLESTDGGANFISIEGNLPDMPVRWGMFAPANAQLNGATGGDGGIILATEMGVWTTSQINGSSTVWIPNNTGLANVRVDMLRYRPSDNTLAAATHGRGLFTTTIPTVITADPGPPANTKDFIKYINSENNRLQIVAGTLQTRTMTIQLFDMSGRKVYELSGAYRTTTISTMALPRGVYTLRCTGDRKESYISKFIK